MRELSLEESKQVNGGNLVLLAYGAIQVAGAAYAGYTTGQGITNFNTKFSNMSLGEAIYHTVN